MPRWSPQLYRKKGLDAGIPDEVLNNALAAGEHIAAINPDLPPVLTLRHLAHLAGVDYGPLRAITSRANLEPYRIFRIRKRPSYPDEVRFRIIAVPAPVLLKTQR